MLREAIPFQGDLDALLDEPPPLATRLTGHLLAIALASAIAVAALAKVDTVVRGTGRLAADEPTILLQPIERAIVRELRVKAGDVVAKGQIVATLDPTFSAADLNTLSGQRAALLAAITRLQAELAEAVYPLDPRAGPDALLQAVLQRERRAQYVARLQALDSAIEGDEASQRATGADSLLLGRQLAVTREVEAIRARLLAVQAGSRLLLLEAQNESTRAERAWRAAQDRLTELQHGIAAKRAERSAFVESWRSDLLAEMVRAKGELAKVEDALAKAARLHELVEVTAPKDGVVLDVAARAAGSVLREAEPLMSLLPLNTRLIADVQVDSADVGYLRPEDRVVVKVDAFPYQHHGALTGRLRSIGQESLGANGQPDGGAPPGRLHRVQVAVDGTGLTGLPDGAQLIPGMTVVAEIRTGTRTILSYVLDPLTRGLGESMTEP